MKYWKAIAVPLLGAGLSIPSGVLAHTFDPHDDLPIAGNSGEIFGWGRMAVNGDQIPPGQASPRVYVIDAGVGKHEDLPQLNIPGVQRRFNPSGGPLIGCYGHATHVAGIIGAQIGNGAVAGVAAGADIISVSVHFQEKAGTTCGDPAAITKTSVMNALEFVRQDLANRWNQGDRATAVVNISLNNPVIWGDVEVRQKVWEVSKRTATYAGALVVQSAGNDANASSACTVAYQPPNGVDGTRDGIITVGAAKARLVGSDVNNVLGFFTNPGVPSAAGSNWGPCVELWAPGELIWSTYNGGDNTTDDQNPDVTYPACPAGSPPECVPARARLSGTSMAAPHVAGIAARMLVDDPQKSPEDLEVAIRNASLYIGTDSAGTPMYFARLPSTDPDGDQASPSWTEYLDGTNPYVKDNNIFAGDPLGNRRFVRQQYRDFLDRPGDHASIESWTTWTGQNGLTALTQQFFWSGEFYGYMAPVSRLYLAYFLRQPDFGGLRYWSGQFKSGLMSLNAISDVFASSPEFNNAYPGLTNAQFVQRVYLNVLGRNPDEQGWNYWTDQLNGGMTRGQLMVNFSECAEFQALIGNEVLTTLTFYGLLRRSADATEYPGWVDWLDSGNTHADMLTRFILHPEYRARFLP